MFDDLGEDEEPREEEPRERFGGSSGSAGPPAPWLRAETFLIMALLKKGRREPRALRLQLPSVSLQSSGREQDQSGQTRDVFEGQLAESMRILFSNRMKNISLTSVALRLI